MSNTPSNINYFKATNTTIDFESYICSQKVILEVHMIPQIHYAKKPQQIGERNSSFELLRILSILFIILHHYSAHGVPGLTEHALTTNKIIEQILSMGGNIGVNCFVLITGYFMTNGTLKYKKLLRLILEVFFYSVISMIVFYEVGLETYDSKVVKESLFPHLLDKPLFWLIDRKPESAQIFAERLKNSSKVLSSKIRHL